MKTLKKALFICVVLCIFRCYGMTFASEQGNFFMKEIKLTRNKVALVDDKDFEYLNQFKWQGHLMRGDWYATRGCYINGKHKIILMHREIMGVLNNPKIFIDHQNKNGLHNYKDNLRKCSHSQNMANRKSHKNSTSKFLGVSWNKRNNNWRVQIQVNKDKKNIGSFKNESEAAKAYDIAAKKYFGKFASLNNTKELLDKNEVRL